MAGELELDDKADTYDLLKLDDEENLEDKKDDDEGDEEKDTKRTAKKINKDDKKDDDQEDEEELKVEDDDEVDDKKLELISPPKRKEILKLYPDIFKKLPQLEHAIYREHAFSELFGTVDTAKETLEKAKDYDNFSTELMKGDIGSTLKSVKDSDGEAFNGIVDSFLPTLARVDNNAYNWLIGDVLRKGIISAVKTANEKGNTDEGKALLAAAATFHEYVFGHKNLQNPTKFGKDTPQGTETKETKENDSVKEERAKFIMEKFESHKESLDNKIENTIKGTLDTYLDPKNLMSPYIKKNAINDAIKKFDTIIHQDNRFTQLLDKYWQAAFENNFNQDSMGRIRSAILSKAKTLLPDIMKEIRAEALQSQGQRKNDDRPRNKDVSEKVSERTINRSHNDGEKKKDGRGMKTADFFAQD